MDGARNGPGKKPASHVWRFLFSGLVIGVVLSAVFAWALNATDQRQFCATCHIMHEAAVTQKMGMHANLSCNECHAPHALLAKIPFKAQAGAEDIIGNFQGKSIPIPASKRHRDVVNQNCINCHAPVNATVASMAVKPYCTDCHRSVAHRRLTPISERTVGYD
ncbi:MAG: 7-cyano-7-deazaguanine reductase [Desulfovibrio sp.]|nr:7-cyano-7-deazaguanine reductase [Desulfovibrio sp.]